MRLQCTWLGGTLLRAPQVEPRIEIFATKLILDPAVGVSIAFFLCSWQCTDTSLSHANGDTGLENLTANRLSIPGESGAGIRGESVRKQRLELVNEMRLVVVAAFERLICPSFRRFGAMRTVPIA
jgi:hypothetical protein